MSKNKIYTRFEKFFTLAKKSIYIAWYRHHFIIPPRSIYKYAISFFKNLRRGNGASNLYLNQKSYLKWYEKYMQELKEEELDDFAYKPKFSFVVPCYNTPKKELRECIESLLDQSYRNFEIVICDDASTNKETLLTLDTYKDKITIIHHKKNQMISAATNTAIKKSTGDFLVFVDNDDVLHKDALYYIAEALNKNKDLDFIYTDEDKIDFNGSFIEPHFKPDFSPDSLMTVNYINHLTCIKKSLVDEVGGLRSQFDGAQDYDLNLRILSKTNKVFHIKKVLYHWRKTPNSTADLTENKSYILDTGVKVLQENLKHKKIRADVCVNQDVDSYLVKYKTNNQKISIIIPIHDNVNVTKRCIDSLYQVNTYQNFEIIIADNNSELQETKDYLKDLKTQHNNIQIIEINEEFNYSRINNVAATYAKGEFLLLLNNDTEVIDPDFLEWMLGYAQNKNTGCVGIKLLFPSRHIQHAGVVIGYGGVAGHIYVSSDEEELGIFGRAKSPSNFSAVTAACLMIEKLKFEEVGGFDEKLKVALNDVDLCLKVLDKGYYNVCINNISMLHYESKSRGYDASKEKHERYLSEQKYMKERWGDALKYDKYFSEYYF